MNTTIVAVRGRQILDSRGNPTVEVDVELESGARGRAAVPSGASTGVHEAVELRDGGDAYGGKGVTQAVANVGGELAEAVTGLDAADQRAVDERLIEADGTPNKGRLGRERDPRRLDGGGEGRGGGGRRAALPLARRRGGHVLPVPMLNIVNGGAHADNAIDFQEFMVVPVGAAHLRRRPADRRGGVPLAEGAPARARPLHRGRRRGRLRAGSRRAARRDRGGVRGGRARGAPGRRSGSRSIPRRPSSSATAPTAFEGGELDDAAMLVDLYASLAERFPIVSVEDGLAEDDWDGWRALTERLGDRLQLVGDDLFVTNVERLRRGIEKGVANSILVKVNQIGTLTETLDAISLARSNGYTAVISHRSGETEDTTIADLAVATGTGQIKTGAPSRSDRVAKYNQLLRIEEELGASRRLSGLVGVSALPAAASLRRWPWNRAARRSSPRSGLRARRPAVLEQLCRRSTARGSTFPTGRTRITRRPRG